MQIFINGKYLTQAVSGVQRYAIELTKCLIAQDPAIRILVPKKLDLNKLEIPAEFFIETGNYSNYNLWEQIQLPIFLTKQPGILLNFCNTAPLLVRNQIVCIHDVAFFENPSWYSKSFYRYYKFLIPKLIRNSKHIVTVSEFSKGQIISRFKEATTKTSVIYNAPADNFVVPFDALTFNKENTFLFVGSFDPRKNLKTLLAAFASEKLKDANLIVVGKRWTTFPDEDLIIPENVRVIDKCNDQYLSFLYKQSKGLINCSLYEGFGLPIVEAMASGCPLLLSNIPVFNEIAGSNALYFDPELPDSIIEAISILNEKSTDDLSILIKNNYLASFRFSWKESSLQLQDILNSLTPRTEQSMKISSSAF